jgi:hypothetical protein
VRGTDPRIRTKMSRIRNIGIMLALLGGCAEADPLGLPPAGGADA